MSQILHDEFINFFKTVFSPDEDGKYNSHQIACMKSAFYAGAKVVLEFGVRGGGDVNKALTQGDLQYVVKLMEEVRSTMQNLQSEAISYFDNFENQMNNPEYPPQIEENPSNINMNDIPLSEFGRA